MPKPSKYASPFSRPAPEKLEPRLIRPPAYPLFWIDELNDGTRMGIHNLVRTMIDTTSRRIERENAEHRRAASEELIVKRYEVDVW